MRTVKRWGLPVLLAAAIARLWLAPLPSSFWVDETATAFVVRHGAGHPSFAAAPQVPQSVYYWMPAASEKILGFSEIAYRIPSVIAMAIALLIVASLAARLIQTGAGWFAVFACLALRGIDYEAADARPYGVGICMAAAALLFLVRWLDRGRWHDALLFLLCAAMLWRVQLIFWPFYIVFAVAAAARLSRGESAVSWARAAAVFAILTLALVPTAIQAAALYRHAGEHVIAERPSARALLNALKPGLILICGGAAWIVGRWLRRPRAAGNRPADVVLFASWWLTPPVSLYVFSVLTGHSLFVSRYYSLALPGAALAATALAGRFLPATCWKPAAAAVGIAALLVNGQWAKAWPAHQDSDWRGAARAVRGLAASHDTPVICPSPFIEARPPAWRPDYALPGFLYAHLDVYPAPGRLVLLPFEPASADSPEVDAYAAEISRKLLLPAGRFVLYGGAGQVRYWNDWFARRPEFATWGRRRIGDFGDVTVILAAAGPVERSAGVADH